MPVLILAAAVWLGRIGEDLWGSMATLSPRPPHPLGLMFGVSGTLMTSTIRIPKP